MPSTWKWKAIAAAIATLAAIYFVLPNFISPPEDLTEEQQKNLPWYMKALPDSEVRLGLDLQGGIHMVLGIDLERALYNEVDRYAQDMREVLPEEKVPVKDIVRQAGTTKIQVTLADPADSGVFEKFLRDRFLGAIVVEESMADTATYILDMDPKRITQVEKETIGQALETLRNRLDEFGVAEPTIQAKGNDQIIVQLPGLDDPERAKNVLGRTAQLEFKMVDDESIDGLQLEQMVADAKKDLGNDFTAAQLNEKLEGKLPPGTQVLLEEQQDSSSGQTIQRPVLLKSETLITGDMLEDARIGTGQYNEPVVNLRLNAVGTEKMANITRPENIGKRMAIILDDRVQSAPQLNDRITNGRAMITFGSLRSRNEMLQEAKDLALVLRAGALPAPVDILQTRAVGPSLGRDSIEKGMKAILVGVLAIIVFMAIYYQMAGIVANFAVITNLIFIMACLGVLHATLTLPGIAGILISIGMAVDANVIIYERIREELREGKTIKASIEAGYERANLTILDSNITTIITALVLLEYGTGPIRGFAVTLIFGLIANYITALWFTRIAFDWVVQRFNPKRMSI